MYCNSKKFIFEGIPKPLVNLKYSKIRQGKDPSTKVLHCPNKNAIILQNIHLKFLLEEPFGGHPTPVHFENVEAFALDIVFRTVTRVRFLFDKLKHFTIFGGQYETDNCLRIISEA